MAIATKNKRKIKVGGRDFVWFVSGGHFNYVPEERFFANLILHVASQDKNFIVKYHLGQPAETRHLIVLGQEFNGLPDLGGNWRRFLCPKFEENSMVTPGLVRRLIEWCLAEKPELIEVDGRGKSIAK